jgi:diacylglycerol kinase
VKKLIDSFKYAMNGLVIVFREERNFKIHIIASIVVIILAAYLEVSNQDFAILVIAIALVLIAEVFNTVVESILDFISPEYDFNVKKIKDLAAGAVFLAATFAIIIGVLVFSPHFIRK